MRYIIGICFMACFSMVFSCSFKSEGTIKKDSSEKAKSTGAEDRTYTIRLMQRLADPIFMPLSENRLHKVLPRKDWETRESNIHTSSIQAFGRTLSGMSPWLSLGIDNSEEGQLRQKYIELATKCLMNASNPESPDFMFNTKEKYTHERIVHAAYIAYPLLITDTHIWERLNVQQQKNVIKGLKTHREFQPPNNNWLLFAAIIEAAIWKFSEEPDQHEMETIVHGVEQHMDWYLGDGVYGDGDEFHWDYYNSYVIQPLLLETLYTAKKKDHPLQEYLPVVEKRAQRYAEILEHLISPEGTYPIIGRSSVYRFAAFQLLGYVAYKGILPESLDPGATRAALTAVIKNMAEAPGTFDENGWLNAGVVGEQVGARDYYNYTGALYMCSMGLTHLGVPANDPFWTAPSGKWFQKRVWDGYDIPNQTFLKEK